MPLVQRLCRSAAKILLHCSCPCINLTWSNLTQESMMERRDIHSGIHYPSLLIRYRRYKKKIQACDISWLNKFYNDTRDIGWEQNAEKKWRFWGPILMTNLQQNMGKINNMAVSSFPLLREMEPWSLGSPSSEWMFVWVASVNAPWEAWTPGNQSFLPATRGVKIRWVSTHIHQPLWCIEPKEGPDIHSFRWFSDSEPAKAQSQ
jgi:hypothetical protein